MAMAARSAWSSAAVLAGLGLLAAAAHHYLGRGAAHARLLRVIVPSAEAAWINPGVCYNSAGYWHVGGARLVYREHGQVRSIGIASLISWRGRWYVVHFGAVLRTGATGLVDQPAASPARRRLLVQAGPEFVIMSLVPSQRQSSHDHGWRTVAAAAVG